LYQRESIKAPQPKRKVGLLLPSLSPFPRCNRQILRPPRSSTWGGDPVYLLFISLQESGFFSSSCPLIIGAWPPSRVRHSPERLSLLLDRASQGRFDLFFSGCISDRLFFLSGYLFQDFGIRRRRDDAALRLSVGPPPAAGSHGEYCFLRRMGFLDRSCCWVCYCC